MQTEAKIPSWRINFQNKLATAYDVDQKIKERALVMEQEFDMFNVKQQHNEWSDKFHQKLARYEMEIRESESHIPALQKKILEQESTLSKHKETLMQYYEWTETFETDNVLNPNIDDYIYSGWLIEKNSRKKHYKLYACIQSHPARIFGYENEDSSSPISVMEIPKKSIITANSPNNEYEVKISHLLS